MKKFLTIFIVTIMLFSVAGCDLSTDIKGSNDKETENIVASTPDDTVKSTPTKKPEATAKATATATTKEEPENKTMNLTIESCKFTEKITAKDGERVGQYLYSITGGKVFVDVTLNITDNGAQITKDTFSGNLEYDSMRYDFEYCAESKDCINVYKDRTIEKNAGGRVHLYAILPESAKNEKLTIKFKAWDQEYSAEVQPIETVDPLSAKTELKKGDKITAGDLQIEVVDCTYTKVLRASDYEKSQQYTGTYPFVDCVLKITNNGTTSLTTLNTYFITDGQIMGGREGTEKNNNTEIDLNNLTVNPGNTETVHLYGGIAETVDASQYIVRFNYDGNCYYCKVN